MISVGDKSSLSSPPTDLVFRVGTFLDFFGNFIFCLSLPLLLLTLQEFRVGRVDPLMIVHSFGVELISVLFLEAAHIVDVDGPVIGARDQELVILTL